MPNPAERHPTKAIFRRAFHWGRPGARFGFGALPKPVAQSFPRDFIVAALAAGAADPVPVPAALRRAKGFPAAPAASAEKDQADGTSNDREV